MMEVTLKIAAAICWTVVLVCYFVCLVIVYPFYLLGLLLFGGRR